MIRHQITLALRMYDKQRSRDLDTAYWVDFVFSTLAAFNLLSLAVCLNGVAAHRKPIA